jgi:hypothetical protein
MSRRAAKVTQDEIARALKAAAARGPTWRVKITPDGSIELWQSDSAPEKPQEPPLAPAREIVL